MAKGAADDIMLGQSRSKVKYKGAAPAQMVTARGNTPSRRIRREFRGSPVGSNGGVTTMIRKRVC